MTADTSDEGFREQSQSHPGDSRTMDPPPDHGESSYRGHDRLTGKRAVITGGDSGIGRAVAIAFAREGADVLINYLPEEQEEAESTADLIRAAGRTAVTVAETCATRRSPSRRRHGRHRARRSRGIGDQRGLPDGTGGRVSPTSAATSCAGCSRPMSMRCSGSFRQRCRTSNPGRRSSPPRRSRPMTRHPGCSTTPRARPRSATPHRVLPSSSGRRESGSTRSLPGRCGHR